MMRCIPCSERISALTASVAVLAALTLAAPAAAESAAEVAIQGEVAPRCWVAAPATVAGNSQRSSASGKAICNQATPRLASQVRAIEPDGKLAKRGSDAVRGRTAAPMLSARTALEIVVSPQL